EKKSCRLVVGYPDGARPRWLHPTAARDAIEANRTGRLVAWRACGRAVTRIACLYKSRLIEGAGMTIDPVTTAGLVAREVRAGSREGAPRKIVIARRTSPTGRADLWDALTNPERIPRWFLPVSGELKVGGRYQLEGNAGGVVERCDEPELFAVTWEFGEMM